MIPADLTGIVLLFKTVGPAGRAARLHKRDCPMVNTGKGRRSSTKLCDPIEQAEIDDLNERGFKVIACKCIAKFQRPRCACGRYATVVERAPEGESGDIARCTACDKEKNP
jgi:hypothetical protein